MRRNRQRARAGRNRQPRQPRFEPLDARDLLAVDALGLADGPSPVEQFMDAAVMGDLQEWAHRTGSDSRGLFSVRALHHPLDVSLDGVISATDPLIVINHLNTHGARPTSGSSWEELGRFDVNEDRTVSPVDLLHLIDGINNRVGEPGQWWREADSSDAMVADLLDLVRGDLAARAVDETVAHVNYVQELVLDHIDYVRQSVGEDLAGDPHGLDPRAAESRVQAIRSLVDEHLTYLGELVDRHIAELREPETSLVSPGEGEPNAEEDLLRWHVDYIDDLIVSHIDYVRAGVSLEEIDQLIGRHADYLSQLLEIHDVDVSDATRFDHLVSELSRSLEWLPGLGLNDAQRLGLPTRLADAWDTAWRHVGYVGDLIEQHEGVLNEDIDWADTISSHVGYVKDFLRLHF